MKLASLSLVALLAITPAFAKTPSKSAAKPAEATCFSYESVTKSLEDKVGKQGIALKKVEGDEAKNFAKNYMGADFKLPDDTTFMFYRMKEDSPMILVVRFVKGCAMNYGALPARLYPSILEDGSI
jgi:hypothetical protein